jgi:DUF971 family protein
MDSEEYSRGGSQEAVGFVVHPSPVNNPHEMGVHLAHERRILFPDSEKFIQDAVVFPHGIRIVVGPGSQVQGIEGGKRNSPPAGGESGEHLTGIQGAGNYRVEITHGDSGCFRVNAYRGGSPN